MKTLPLFIFMGLVFCSTASFSAEGGGTEPFLIIDVNNNEMFLDVEGKSLGEVISLLERETSIEINGLESKKDQLITFSGNGPSPDMLLRKLFRYLGEKNYACEYADDRLIKVTAFPKGQMLAPKDRSPGDTHDDRKTSVVEVIDVVAETQAESLGLKKGDLILQYDGVRLFRYDDLVEESTKDIGPTPVKMIVLRAGEPMTFFLERDFIGVRVRTKEIPMNTLPADFSSK